MFKIENRIFNRYVIGYTIQNDCTAIEKCCNYGMLVILWFLAFQVEGTSFLKTQKLMQFVSFLNSKFF